VRLLLLLPLAVAGSAAAVAAGAASSSSSGGGAPARAATAPAGAIAVPQNLAAPPQAFAIPAPEPLAGDGATWAPVARASRVYRTPSPSAKVVGSVATTTPEDTRNVVAVLDRRTTGGRVWVRVRIASLPNSRTGWVPRTALGGYTTVHVRLVIDRAKRTATLLDHGKAAMVVPVGVGAPDTPTPRGEYYVRNRLTSYASPFYGPLAFGTSARSTVLTDWPAGGFIGIHGTDRPDLVPGAVSHGCIRLRNADLLRLAERLEIGTPITIE
jgi:lipoprotein-anchoring transpeptidase ErfK/SrfK